MWCLEVLFQYRDRPRLISVSEINIVTTSIFKGRRISLFPRGGGLGLWNGLGEGNCISALKINWRSATLCMERNFPTATSGEIGGRTKKRAVKISNQYVQCKHTPM